MKKLLLALLFILLFASCTVSPKPVYELKTKNHKWKSVWVQGKEFVKLENKNFKVILAFDEIDNEIASFDLEISNNSNKTITVSHDLFKILGLDESGNLNSETYPIDPEEMIIKYKLLESSETARYRTENNNKVVSDLLDLTTDVAIGFSEQTDKERDAHNRDMRDRYRNKKLDDINDSNTHERNKRVIETERTRWSFSALRKTTLPPGFRTKGKVYFKIDLKSSYFTFIVVSNIKLRLMFELEKYFP